MASIDTAALAAEVVLTIKASIATALAPVCERLAAAEARLSVLGDLRDRVVVVETKAGQPFQVPADPAVGELRTQLIALDMRIAKAAGWGAALDGVHERLGTLETKAAPAGERGDPGPAGEQGQPGELGAPGPQGERGEPGAAGATGELGERGLQGERGDAGPVGEKGDSGLQGPAGSPGELGAVGSDGQMGERGLQGEIGQRGPAGEKGEAGQLGAPGADGLAGAPGRDGRDGLPGMAGEKGLDGAPGVNGSDGRAGTDGRDGTLETLKMEQVDERTVRFCFKDGTPVDGGVLKFPVELYRGVWVEKSYERGDNVTWGGSEWHANETTTTKPGEGSKAWTLKVKRGRDGKDGKDGIDGKAGRDFTPKDAGWR